MFFDLEDSKEPVKINRKDVLKEVLPELNIISDDELITNAHSEMFFDIETYPNYFLIGFKNYKTKKSCVFELSPDSTINYEKLQWILWNYLLIGFNSTHYDLPMLMYCLNQANVDQLYQLSKRIINEDLKPRQIEIEYKIKIPSKINHVDLIEVAPLKASLKTYTGRLHCKRMQDLPFNPFEPLNKKEAEFVRNYNINDLDNTELLYEELAPQIKLRCDLSTLYEIDLRSKSDAQIAEHVLVSEVAKLKKYYPKRQIILEGQTYKYNIPSYMEFKTPILQNILKTVEETDFCIGKNGSVEMPKSLSHLKFQIGTSIYKMGIGGLHSTEESVCHFSDSETMLIDKDVESYYPNIILSQCLAPENMGDCFLTVYNQIVAKRIRAKRAGDKVIADSLKIVINGSFGKLGSRYSCLYSPNLMLQVTLSGQLSLLMLIEAIELVGIPVVSANTDGIVIKCSKNRYEELEKIVKEWESKTKFKTEETRYLAIFSRDVNNYIAVKEDLSTKEKGSFSEKGSALNSKLSKNPENQICNDAVIAFLTKNIPIEETIKNSKDVTKFLTVRNVKGGAHKDGLYLGRVVRFYHSKEEKGTINYVTSGNKVPKSEGAKPMMDLAPSIPEDLDFDYYIKEAEDILFDIGYFSKKNTGLF